MKSSSSSFDQHRVAHHRVPDGTRERERESKRKRTTLRDDDCISTPVRAECYKVQIINACGANSTHLTLLNSSFEQNTWWWFCTNIIYYHDSSNSTDARCVMAGYKKFRQIFYAFRQSCLVRLRPKSWVSLLKSLVNRTILQPLKLKVLIPIIVCL